MRRSWLFALALFVVALFVSRSPAAAVVEFCPVSVTALAPIADASGAMRYEYRLAALSPRSVNADLIAQTDNGWYRWSVNGVSLASNTVVLRVRHSGRYQGHAAVDEISYRDQESPTLSVEFPVPVVVRAMWATAASTSGGSTFGWDQKGRVQCDPPAPSDLLGIDRRGEPAPSPTSAPPPPPRSSDAIAVSTPPLFHADCARPFAAPQWTGRSPMSFLPQMSGGDLVTGGMALIAVAVNPDGTIADHWIIGTTMSSDLANAFEMNIASAHFAPAISFCQPVPSIYWYHAQQNAGRR